MKWACPKCSSSSLSVTYTYIQYLEVNPEIITSCKDEVRMELINTGDGNNSEEYVAECDECGTTFDATVDDGEVLIYLDRE